MDKKVEYRNYDCDLEVREDEKHGHILEGVPIVFNSSADLGFFTEIIEPTALDGTDFKDVRFLVNHNTNELPLARSRRNNENSTMQLWVESDGLHIRVDLDVDNNPRAKELYSAVQRQDCSQMSFAFRVDQDTWEGMDTNKPTRRINKIASVVDVSAVTFPAYEASSIVARSLESVKGSLDSAKKELESSKRLNELRLEIKSRGEKIRGKTVK